ncbi:30S ribosomal protein S8 [Candidatus Marinamargulisbacteria bacterium SCGC AG-333-B06]|nr:30S ribosomal protein S8 [Candidatus Marinamargulisbacteria bacterium SCGC AG-333-B06]
MVSDIIADMFTRIRNSLKERHEYVEVPYSTLKFRISQILKEYGFITSFEVFGESLTKKIIKINLKYKKNGTPIISKLDRVSKPSKRIYVTKSEIPKVMNGFGLSLVSTSKGILSGKEARLKNVGGELIGVIW